MSTVTYTNTRGDLLAFTAFHYMLSPWTWVGLGALVLLNMPAILTSVPWEFGTLVGVLMAVILQVALVLFVLTVTAVTVLLTVALRDGRGLFTEHVLSFDDQGVTERTDVNASVSTWAGIRKVTRAGDRYIFIYVAPGMAHLIPRRAVPSHAEWNGLYDRIQVLHQGARA